MGVSATGWVDSLVNRTSTAGLRGRPLRVFVTIVGAVGFSLFGYDQGVMGSLITGHQFNDEFPGTKSQGDDDRHATVIQGAVVSCYEIGCFFGALFALFRGEKLGRKPVIIIGAIIITIGTVISTAAFRQNWGLGQFVVGRVITGIGNGMNTATIPVWQSEMSRPENRGRLVYIEGSTVAFGTFIAYWLDFGIAYDESSVAWRFPIAFQAFFSLILLFGIIVLPESPRWLVAAGRPEEAKLILGHIEDLDSNHDFVLSELSVISEGVERYDNAGQVGFKEMMDSGKTANFQRMIIGASTQFFQQFTGCNAAIYYSTVLFNGSIGLDYKLSQILGGVFSTVYFLASIPAFFIVDKVGRRWMFLVGAGGQGVAFLITMACLAAGGSENAKGAAFGLFLFITFFGCTILQLPWVYPPEINSMRTRTVGTAVSTCTNWISNFAVVMFTPIFVQDAGWGAYLFFSLMNFIFVPIIFFFYPETTGRTLEEIDIIFAKAHLDKAFPFRVASHLPKLSLQQIKEYTEDLGIYDDEKQTDLQIEDVQSSSNKNSSINEKANVQEEQVAAAAATNDQGNKGIFTPENAAADNTTTTNKNTQA